MPFCINCGVELAADVKTCPLCSYAMPDTGSREPPGEERVFPGPFVDTEMVRKTRTVLIAEMLSVVFGVADLALVTIDYALNRAFTWSPYPAAAVTALWVYVMIMLAIARRPYRTLAVSACAILLLLAAIDLADGTMSWFPQLALPIGLSCFLLIFLIFLVFGAAKSYSLVGVSLFLAVCIESLVVDYVVSRFLGAPPFTWSLIVAACVAPMVIVGLVHFFFLRRYFDVEKYLHF